MCELDRMGEMKLTITESTSLPFAKMTEFFRVLLMVSRCRLILHKRNIEVSNPTNLFERLSYGEIKTVININEQIGDPKILSVQHNSPIIITITATMAVLVTLAFILSGGHFKFEFDCIKIDLSLPSLGSGIKSLRDSLQRSDSVVYQFDSPLCVIRFNDDEYNELCKTPAGQGGFQSYLTELQHRTRMKTLSLSIVDVEKISRYMNNYGSGGFESRLRKIFGRHI